MKVTLSLEKTSSSDVSIMVDNLRASTSITIALNYFKEIIPAFSPEKAKEIAIEKNAILAGERGGATIEGFDVGNSPIAINDLGSNLDNSKEKTLVLTTSNGTRILEDMDSTVLIGSFVNAKSVAESALKIANSHIDIVMAGVNSYFAIEDFLAAGEILFWIDYLLNPSKSSKNHKNFKNIDNIENSYSISEYAQSAILASRNPKLVEIAIKNSKSANRLIKLGFKDDVDFCLKKNISKNTAIYNEGVLKLIE